MSPHSSFGIQRIPPYSSVQYCYKQDIPSYEITLRDYSRKKKEKEKREIFGLALTMNNASLGVLVSRGK